MSECIVWQGALDGSGYGVRWWRGRPRKAHRVAWELANGPIPAGMSVLHRCDNPPCTNVEHLFLGTQADNVKDAVSKGRMRGAVGERNSHAKLTADDVRVIRARLEAGDKQWDIARAFGVRQALISQIKRGVSWSHVR